MRTRAEQEAERRKHSLGERGKFDQSPERLLGCEFQAWAGTCRDQGCYQGSSICLDVLPFLTFSVSHLFMQSPCLTHEQFGEMFVQSEVLTDRADLHPLELKHIHEVEGWRLFVQAKEAVEKGD